MSTLQTWSDIVISSFQDLWVRFFDFLPSLIGALLVVAFGSSLAVGAGKLVSKMLKKFWFDKAVKKAKISEIFKKAGVPFDPSDLVGALVKWFLIVVFILAAADILNLDQVTEFLNKVLLYFPNVVVAVIILLLGVLFADFISRIVEAAVKTAQLTTGHFLAGIAKWAVIVFSVMAAFVQLGVATSLLQILLTGFVAMLAIAGGLAFGLGGKEQAKKILENLEKDLSKKDRSSTED